jgi:hypothetical protein
LNVTDRTQSCGHRPWLPHAKKFARVEELPTLDIFLVGSTSIYK